MTDKDACLCTLKREREALSVGEEKWVVFSNGRGSGVTRARILELTGTAGSAEAEKAATAGTDSTEGLHNHREEGNVAVAAKILGVAAVLELLGVVGGGKGSGGRRGEVRRGLGVSSSDINGVVGPRARIRAV